MGFIDLHIHSVASDGSMTPEEIVKTACAKGLTAIAITDHDTVDGVQAAVDASLSLPIHVIPGIEFSAEYKGKEVHILGYRINYEDAYFVSQIEKITQLRYERNCRICELLKEQGFDISIEKMHERFNSHVLTRGNFALYLYEHNYVKSIQEAFDKYISKKGPCYVDRYLIPAEDAITLIRQAGGIVSVAHPVLYKMTDEEYDQFFADMKAAGADAVEAIYSENKAGDEQKFKEYADRAGMFITGGSDFHGLSKPDIKIGTGKGDLMVPGTILKNLGFSFS